MLWLHAYLLLSPFVLLPCQESDLSRFPPPVHETRYWSEVEGNCTQPYGTCPGIAARIAWLEANQAMHFREVGEWNEWDEQIKEQKHLEHIWGLLWRAHHERGNGSAAYWLRDLRDEIGEEAYAAGRMPPPIPRARYSEITR